MTDREAIDVLFNEWKCIDRNDGIHCDRKCEFCDLVMDVETIREAYNMAISALQARDSETRKICNTCKHYPSEMDKWPCVDCDMREPADRWEPKDGTDINVEDMVSRQAAIDALMDEFKRVPTTAIRAKNRIDRLPSAQLEIIRCKDCTYGVQDEYGRWYCRSLGCQIGDEDGNGFCSDAERRTDEGSD